MKKIIYNYTCLFLFISPFFLWDVNILVIENFNFYITARYLVLILLIPIIYSLFKNRNYFNILSIFNNQKNILYLYVFVLLHFFLTSIIYNQTLKFDNIFEFSFLFFFALIYCHYRNFLLINFDKFIFLFFLIFICSSLYKEVGAFNAGSCQFIIYEHLEDSFFSKFFKKILNSTFSNGFYKENSHLAMTAVGVIISSIFTLIKSRFNNVIYFSLFIFVFFILILNSSTTLFISYLVSQTVLILFFNKKIPNIFWFYTLILFVVFGSILLFKTDCKNKITHFNLQHIAEKKILKSSSTLKEPNKGKNLTTLIYERSIILSLDTLYEKPLGWGMNNMDNATANLLNKPDNKNIYIYAKLLNLKDGLGNLFKLITEFGFFSFFIFYMFIKYMINLKKINSYHLFIIVLFVTQCLRGAGYFNGGFIFCLFEFFYFANERYQKKQSPFK